MCVQFNLHMVESIIWKVVVYFRGFYLYKKVLRIKRTKIWLCFSLNLFWEEQNIRFHTTNHLLRLVLINELFVSRKVFFLIFHYLSLNFAFFWNMLHDIIRFRFIFRMEEKVDSLLNLYGHSFCLMTGLQYFIKTHFETK